MHMNWKTTVSGMIAAVAPLIRGLVPVELAPVVDGVQMIAIALLGYFARDAD